MTLQFAPSTEGSLPLHVISSDSCSHWLGEQDERTRSWADANSFSGKIGQALLIPDKSGLPCMALAGFGTARERTRNRFNLAAAAASLPEGNYRIASALPDDILSVEALGWLLGQYRFDRYRKVPANKASLVAPEGIDARRIETHAKGEALTRDMINTPSQDMGPDEIEAIAHELGRNHGAHVSAIAGSRLLEQNFPMIHAVGRASDQAPRLIELNWGGCGPQLTLVGKGVCFDTGGLNLKPARSMALMKKDMGGAATALGLAAMIMELGLSLRLRLLIPAVENSVAGNSFRPGDILTARCGYTVEVNNTDAEGRLVLADALSFGAETEPDLMVSVATLTGAARVAVGADLAPFYTDDDHLAAALERAAPQVADPVWRLPFHAPYERLIEPGIADLDNAPAGGLAGSITAALFLRRFTGNVPYAHFDIYGWQPRAAPGRPKGGLQQGARALLEALPCVLEL